MYHTFFKGSRLLQQLKADYLTSHSNTHLPRSDDLQKREQYWQLGRVIVFYHCQSLSQNIFQDVLKECLLAGLMLFCLCREMLSTSRMSLLAVLDGQ